MYSSSDVKFLDTRLLSQIPQDIGVSKKTTKLCFHKLGYIWTKGGNEFYVWLTRADDEYAYGYKWNGIKWIKFRIKLCRIKRFKCLKHVYR